MRINLIIMLIGMVMLSGCSTTGSVSEVRQLTTLINFGDTKERVLEVLGNPGDRSFLGSSEAWQYCSTGWSSDTYATVWFENGSVNGITSKNSTLAYGNCTVNFPEIDWGQRPADRKIDITVN